MATLKHTLRVGENLAAHIGALVAGFAMMIVGIGLGVTMIGLFLAVPIGVVGLGLFLWGGWGFGEARRR